MTDFFKTLTILAIAFLTIYTIIHLFKMNSINNQYKYIEGMENNSSASIGVLAKEYSEKIKGEVDKMKVDLSVGNYRKDYENSIINMDDLVGLLMIRQVQSMKATNDPKELISQFDVLNTLKSTKESLNVTMKFLDGL